MLRAAFFLNKWLRWTRLAFLSSMVCRETNQRRFVSMKSRIDCGTSPNST